ncbi:site-specific integrase [Halobellus ordinarius]|uniref:site-specific integrase n=1 Tax=Halobellus ordinarius TaxID=3075120 RepID=UPI002880807A|nr:site-specific integrase [Halobellus sp. ZY16]
MSTQHSQGHGRNPIHAAGRSADPVRHSKADAVDDREFERLLEGARELGESQYYYEPDPVFTVYVLGRLGLRRGELCHLREDWIDWREQMIRIPEHDSCRMGKDGRQCGYCRQLAKQRVEYAEDDAELDTETALEWMWVPKTKAAAREIYYGWDPRAAMYIERYFDSPEYSRYEASGAAVNRRVKKAAELGGLNPESIHPHALRATAATFHAARGLAPTALMQMFGWANLDTAEVYIGRNSGNTARQLDAIHQN